MGVVKCSACGGMVSEMAAACPHCGQGASAYMFGIFAANTIKNDYQCKNCGHKFC